MDNLFQSQGPYNYSEAEDLERDRMSEEMYNKYKEEVAVGLKPLYAKEQTSRRML